MFGSVFGENSIYYPMPTNQRGDLYTIETIWKTIALKPQHTFIVVQTKKRSAGKRLDWISFLRQLSFSKSVSAFWASDLQHKHIVSLAQKFSEFQKIFVKFSKLKT